MSMFTAEYQDFKREDPTVLVKVTLYDDQKNVIKPVISKAKLVQGTKYAGDYEITQDGDQYCLSTKQIAKLPSGSYGMELWADDGSIYPSAGFIPIRIHRNADDSLEKTKPTIDLDSIIEDLHKAGLNVVFDKIEMLDSNQPASVTSSVRDGKNHITLKIPRGIKGDTGATGPQGPKGDKGDKGDTGTVDNAGLTTAPAFVNLQTQVNNSTVGTNLALGTSNQVVQATDWNMKVADIKYDKSLGGTLCASVMINNADHASDLQRGSAYIALKTLDKNGNILATVRGNWVGYNASGLSQCSISIDDNTASVQAYIITADMNENAFYSCLKVEKGNVATDWCPNPAEIMTQADYAKIKAAIVALGGSLK